MPRVQFSDSAIETGASEMSAYPSTRPSSDTSATACVFTPDPSPHYFVLIGTRPQTNKKSFCSCGVAGHL